MAMGSSGPVRVAVVGAGFSGLMFALSLLKEGLSVDVYEEHGRVGFPEHCTGLVSGYTAGLIGRPAERARLAEFDAVVISGPAHSVEVRPRGGVVKLDRVRLEEAMLDEVEREGGRVHLGVRAKVGADGTVLPSGARYDVVVLAEGYFGRLAGRLGLRRRGRVFWGVNEELEYKASGPFVARFDGVTSGGFFSWFVPLGDRVLVGTASRDPRAVASYLGEARRAFGVDGSPRVKVYGGPVLAGPPVDSPRVGRVVVVGDAAFLNKPLTGGGLYPNAEAATRAAALIRAGEDPLRALERSVREVGRSLSRAYHLARLVHGRPRLVDALAQAASASGLAARLSGLVDYDRHERLLGAAARAGLPALGAAARLLRRDPLGAALLLAASLRGAVGL